MIYQQDMMAEEDMQLLVAITEKLVKEQKTFTINLPYNTKLTNQDGGNVQDLIPTERFAFAGIDFIKDMEQQYRKVTNEPCILIMPTDKMFTRTYVGELFGMKVYADPRCPKDKMLIQPPQGEQENEI